MVTRERVLQLFDYCPESGFFTRKKGRAGKPPGSIAGSLDRKGYVCIGIDFKMYKAHRLAWLVVHSTMPSFQIDHINRKRADNRISNLRIASPAENLQNRESASRRSASGLIGVSWHKKTKAWRAKIQCGGTVKSLGYHKSKEEASEAYLKAKAALHPFWCASSDDPAAT